MTRFYAVPGAPILLGRQGENLVREIAFDVSELVNDYGDGYAQLFVRRHGETEYYMAPLERKGHLVVWSVTSADVGVAGMSGSCELSWVPNSGLLAKASAWSTQVLKSANAPEEPDTNQSWIDSTRQIAADVQRGAAAAEDAAETARKYTEQIGAALEGARDSARLAQSSEKSASEYAAEAGRSQTAAENASARAAAAEDSSAKFAGDADYSAEQAAESAGYASEHRAAAEKARDDAVLFAQGAMGYAESANTAKDEAQDAAGDAQWAKDLAEEAISKTPHVGANGNWYAWNPTKSEFADTGIAAQGEKGDTGKTAYEYAKDADYLGTEADFAHKMAVEYIDWFGAGIEIPDNADLNNYKTPGKYYVRTEASAKTIKNKPTGMNTNFCMFVFIRTDAAAAVVTQMMFTLSCKEYLRSTSTTSFRPWTEYTTTEEIAGLIEQARSELSTEMVKYTEQDLTEDEKEQARANIGAVSLADLPSAQIPSDWAQSDTTAPDYIKNRPLYEKGSTVILEWTGFSVGPYDDNAKYLGGVELVAGRVYRVNFDGTDYACRAYSLYPADGSSEPEYVAIGNIDICDEANFGEEYDNKGNGEPFALEYGVGVGLYVYVSGAGSHTIQISEEPGAVIEKAYREAISRLAEDAYIPDTVLKLRKQDLTREQMEQARANIGALSAADVAPAQVPSDWDQNDSAQPDYIKNRPFYTEYGDVVVEEQTVTTSDTDEGTFAGLSAVGAMEVGKTYVVVANGVAYDCVAYHPQDEDTGRVYYNYVCAGNASHFADAIPGVVGGGDEPFVVVQFDDLYELYTDTASAYTVRVSESGGVIKLDPKYLDMEAIRDAMPPVEQVQPDWEQEDETAPDFIKNKPDIAAAQVPSDWEQNDESKPDYIKNRPFYEVPEYVAMAERAEGTTGTDEGSTILPPVYGGLEVGRTYKVWFDGQEYECVAVHLTEDGGEYLTNDVAVGNVYHARLDYASLDAPNTGEPFAVIHRDDMLTVYCATDGLHTIEVVRKSRMVVDEKYSGVLNVVPDWNQNDSTKPDYVKNRPMYAGDHVVIAEEQTVETGDDGESINAELSMSGELEVGKTYTVTFNGTVYECVAYHPIFSEDGTEDTYYIYLGEPSLGQYANPGYEGPGRNEPFLVIRWAPGDYFLYTASEAECTIEVMQDGTVIEPVYQAAIKKSLPVVELTATLEDGTKQTIKLYGEVVGG